MVFFAFQDLFLAQLADFGGQAAAVHFQIVCQFLPVIGDGEAVAALDFCLVQQVCHQFFPGGPFGGDLDLLIEYQVLGGHQPQKVEDDPAVESAGAGTGG